MRLTLALIFGAGLACTGGTKDKAEPTEESPSDHEGDEAGECVDGADNDRDGDFDCDDANCSLSPDCEEEEETDVDTDTDSDTDSDTDTDTRTDAEVNYSGAVLGILDYSGTELPCEGEVDLTVRSRDGSAAGEANCVMPDFGVELAGELFGDVDGTRFVGVWEASAMGGAVLAIPVEGTVRPSLFEATFDTELSDDQRFYGSFEARP